jgi:hypothetical protein
MHTLQGNLERPQRLLLGLVGLGNSVSAGCSAARKRAWFKNQETTKLPSREVKNSGRQDVINK